MTKAKEALLASNNDFDSALKWLQKDLETSGLKKAQKLGGRETKEGLIGVSIFSPGYGGETGAVRAAMVEMNCETDFVARNELFGKLVSDIAHSVAFSAEDVSSDPLNEVSQLTAFRPWNVDALLDLPYISKLPSSLSAPPQSIASAVRDTIAKTGENMTLRRAVSIVLPPDAQAQISTGALRSGFRITDYVHSPGADGSVGRIGSIVLTMVRSEDLKALFDHKDFRKDLKGLERALARQAVAFDTHFISSNASGEDPNVVLYDQPFIMYPGEFSEIAVKTALQKWSSQAQKTYNKLKISVDVTDLIKWTVGQDISSPDSRIISGKASVQKVDCVLTVYQIRLSWISHRSFKPTETCFFAYNTEHHL